MKRHAALGLSLVELVVFIVVVSVSVAGVLMAIDRSARFSADPLVIKQALAIAEAVLEEVELMPFTFCDPDDPAVSTAASPAGCTTPETAMGPEAVDQPPTGPLETRNGAVRPFDNVNDYAGYDSNADGGIKDITGTLITGLGAYRAQVAVAAVAFGGITLASGDALQITVTVTGPAGFTVNVAGIRTRYAPNL